MTIARNLFSQVKNLAQTIAVVLLAVALLGCVGCSKGESGDAPVDDMPAPVSESERTRGLEACKEYVARACACADKRPDDSDLRERCDLAPAKLSSLNMLVQANRTAANAEDRLKTGATIHRTIGSCISGQGELDSLGCER